MDKTSRGIFGIDRYVLDSERTRLVVRRESDPAYKFGKFLVVGLAFFVSMLVGALATGFLIKTTLSYWRDLTGEVVYIGPNIDPFLFLSGGLLAIWPTRKVAQAMPSERSRSFLFTDQYLTNEESGEKYERRYTAPGTQQFEPAVTGKNAGQLNDRAIGAKKFAERRGNSVYVYHGSKKSFLMKGLGERQALVLYEIIENWRAEPKTLHAHDI